MKITRSRAIALVHEAFPGDVCDEVVWRPTRDGVQGWAWDLAQTLCTWEDNERSRAVALVYGALIKSGNYCAGHRTTLRRAETAVDAVLDHYLMINKRGPSVARCMQSQGAS